MIYDTVARTIADMCFKVGLPLPPCRIAQLLGNELTEELVSTVCFRMVDEGKLVRIGDSYTPRNLVEFGYANMLIREEYQQLGMRLMKTDGGERVRYIPAEAEHRFLEVGQSRIGSGAGLGLFVRRNRRIPQGCVLCEYRGRSLRALPSSVEHGVYVVKVRGTGTYIDGVAETGAHLSLATFINDDGPLTANARMMEYDRHPGRVFIVAQRDIEPGEEVLVMYGASYWGFTSYSELQASIASRHSKAARRVGKRARSQSPDWSDGMMDCRRCGAIIARRAAGLHAPHCGDALAARDLFDLRYLPYCDFTAVENGRRVVPGLRARAMHVATQLVALEDPQTFSHTHEDFVRDLEFTFADVEDAP